MSQLDDLKKVTKVVADSGDFESMRIYKPQDATTNPSLILQAIEKPQYRHLLDEALTLRKSASLAGKSLVTAIFDRILILFGKEILKIVPGRVSTEVDARLSFDIEGSIAKARQLIGIYEAEGIPRERILIKLASTWEGTRAAEVLQKEGINCNMTLLFSLPQAVACADAGARLISPFVGRILDWYKAATKKDYAPAEDPGVVSVTSIFHYYKKFGYKTEVMGASFRNKGEITELAGCDLLTISPALLGELQASNDPLPLKLNAAESSGMNIERRSYDEKTFRYEVNDDAMATEKTAEGIRKFAVDVVKLEKLIAAAI